MDNEWRYDVSPDSELGEALQRLDLQRTILGALNRKRYRWEPALRDAQRLWMDMDGDAVLDDAGALKAAAAHARRHVLTLALEDLSQKITEQRSYVDSIEDTVRQLQARRGELVRLLDQPGSVVDDRKREIPRAQLERELIRLVGEATHAPANP